MRREKRGQGKKALSKKKGLHHGAVKDVISHTRQEEICVEKR